MLSASRHVPLALTKRDSSHNSRCALPLSLPLVVSPALLHRAHLVANQRDAELLHAMPYAT